MNRILPLSVLVISIVLYILAPNSYSFGYCSIIHGLFLVEAICLYIYDLQNEKVGFNLLFSISFYFTSFVFPCFIYQINPHYSLFTFSYNIDVLSRSTALAQIAYASYTCGYMWNLNKAKSYNNKLDFGFTIPEKIVRKVGILISIFVVIFIKVGGIVYFQDRYLRSEMTSNLIVQYLILFFTPITIFLSSLIPLVRQSSQAKYIYLILIAIAIILSISGTRTIPLFIFSALFTIYCNKHKISLLFIIFSIIVGTIFLSYIGQIRSQGIFTDFNFNASGLGWLEGFSDLFINNRNLYVLYDYVQNNGCTYGLSMASGFLSPIPFAQSIFKSLTGIPDFAMGSPGFTTFLQFGSHPPFGLGTHIVGDVYLSVGMPGVLILFTALGLFITDLRNKMWTGSYYNFLIYIIMSSYAIYMCRASYFGTLRTLVWTMIISYFILNRYIPKKPKLENNC